MRLPLIAPAELSAEQRPVYDDMKDRHREELSGLQDHRRQRRADGAMEPMAARAEIRQADLGPDPGDVGVAVAAGPGQGSGDPGHRRGLPLGVRALCPCHRRGARRSVR